MATGLLHCAYFSKASLHSTTSHLVNGEHKPPTTVVFPAHRPCEFGILGTVVEEHRGIQVWDTLLWKENAGAQSPFFKIMFATVHRNTHKKEVGTLEMVQIDNQNTPLPKVLCPVWRSFQCVGLQPMGVPMQNI